MGAVRIDKYKEENCLGEEVQTLKDVLLMLTNPKNIPANVSEAQAKKMLVGFIKRFIRNYTYVRDVDLHFWSKLFWYDHYWPIQEYHGSIKGSNYDNRMFQY